MRKSAGAPLPPYRKSLAGTLLAAREAVMSPIRPVLRTAGVTEQQWRVLRVLADEGPSDASGLGDKALLYAPSVTRILKELVDRGLVSRVGDPVDGRRSIVSISPDGSALVARVAQRTREILDIYAQLFGDERLAALRGELEALTQAIRHAMTGNPGQVD